MKTLAVYTDSPGWKGFPLAFNIADCLRGKGMTISVLPIPRITESFVLDDAIRTGSSLFSAIPDDTEVISIVWLGRFSTIPPKVYARLIHESTTTLNMISDLLVVVQNPLFPNNVGESTHRRWMRRLRAEGLPYDVSTSQDLWESEESYKQNRYVGLCERITTEIIENVDLEGLVLEQSNNRFLPEPVKIIKKERKAEAKKPKLRQREQNVITITTPYRRD